MLTLSIVAVQLLLSVAVKAQVTEGQTFPGGVIVSVNPGGSTSSVPPPITTLVPAPEPEPTPEPEPEPDPEQIAIDALCTGELNQESWDAANMNDFVTNAYVLDTAQKTRLTLCLALPHLVSRSMEAFNRR